MSRRTLLTRAFLFVPILLPASIWGEEVYQIGYSKYRDISSIEQSLSIERILGERFEVSIRGMNTGDINETLDRFGDSRGGDFRLGLPLARGLNLNLSGKGRKRRDEGRDYTNQTTQNQLSLDLSYCPLSYLSISSSIGPVFDSYQRTSLARDTVMTNGGIRDSLLVTVEQGRGHTHYLQIGERREITEKRVRQLGCGIKRRMLNWVEAGLEAEGEVTGEAYPTMEGAERKDFRRGLGELSFTARPTHQLKLELTTSVQGEEHRYASEENPEAREKGRVIKRRGAEGHISYSVIEPVELNLSLGRTFRHRDYERDRSDEYLDEKSFNGSIDYRLGEGNSVRFERTITLSSYDLLHRYNFDDRDLLNQSFGLSTDFLLPRATSLLTRISTQDNSIIYLRKEMAANNRRLTIYEFSNLVGFSPLRNLQAENILGIRANYTTYQFNPQRSTLVRSVRLGGRLSYVTQETHPYRGDYVLTVEDRGAYLFNSEVGEWRFRRDTQIFKHELFLSLPLMVEETFSLVPCYGLKTIRTFGYVTEGTKREKGKEDEHHLCLSGNLLLSKASTLELSVGRIIREENPFWDLKAFLNYNF